MKVLLTGATGLIGKEIGKKLIEANHELVVTTRNKNKAKAELPFKATIVEWQGYNEAFPLDALTGVEAIIHLAGESIAAKRWSKKQKELIYKSRIESTRKIVDAVLKLPSEKNLLKTFISASAIGIYGENNFLATVCKDWEGAANQLPQSIRVVHPRIGIVLSSQGGALEKMLPLFSNGLGGVVGSGNQWMSWIHVEDVARIFVHALTHTNLTGPVDAVAPNPETNKSFSAKLAKALDKKLFLPVPSFALKLALGEMSTLVLDGKKVSAKEILASGFEFKYPTVEEALADICTPLKNYEQELVAEQWLPQKPEEVFPFFCDETNLEKITPNFLNFHVIGKSTPKMQNETIIDYKLKLYGIPLRWRSRIEDWNPGSKFVDTQIKGPYSKWHHTHEFFPYQGGTLLRDKVKFKVPFGFLGNLFSGSKVKSDVKNIFSHRRKVIANLYYS